MLQHHI